MFQNKQIGLAFAIVVVLAALVTYATGRAMGACARACDLVNLTCSTNANSTCVNCYSYTNNSLSCWICGTGSPGGGMCNNGDPTLDCQAGTTQIQWQQWTSCGGWCSSTVQVNNPNSWSNVFTPLNALQVFGMETRYLCNEGNG